ncbi:hypothetical protein Vi05172_g8745 [Venturia inaequalis]|nr:hypothetical protein Vi05172_g8745 [Venturia inaequalis]
MAKLRRNEPSSADRRGSVCLIFFCVDGVGGEERNNSTATCSRGEGEERLIVSHLFGSLRLNQFAETGRFALTNSQRWRASPYPIRRDGALRLIQFAETGNSVLANAFVGVYSIVTTLSLSLLAFCVFVPKLYKTCCSLSGWRMTLKVDARTSEFNNMSRRSPATRLLCRLHFEPIQDTLFLSGWQMTIKVDASTSEFNNMPRRSPATRLLCRLGVADLIMWLATPELRHVRWVLDVLRVLVLLVRLNVRPAWLWLSSQPPLHKFPRWWSTSKTSIFEPVRRGRLASGFPKVSSHLVLLLASPSQVAWSRVASTNLAYRPSGTGVQQRAEPL